MYSCSLIVILRGKWAFRYIRYSKLDIIALYFGCHASQMRSCMMTVGQNRLVGQMRSATQLSAVFTPSKKVTLSVALSWCRIHFLTEMVHRTPERCFNTEKLKGITASFYFLTKYKTSQCLWWNIICTFWNNILWLLLPVDKWHLVPKTTSTKSIWGFKIKDFLFCFFFIKSYQVHSFSFL